MCRERTDSKRSPERSETRLKSPLELRKLSWLLYSPDRHESLPLISLNKQQGNAAGCRMGVELMVFMRAHLYSVVGGQET